MDGAPPRGSRIIRRGRAAARPPQTAAGACGPGLLAAGLGLLLVCGCTEHGAMPTRPDAPGADPDGWRRIYPVTANQQLHAAWGMDATDMWAVGNRGTILHHDGKSVTVFDAPTRGDLMAIDGCARDEIWAVARSGEVLRWDGRRWTLIAELDAHRMNSIHCLAPGSVVVGGSCWDGNDYRPAVWHRDGLYWTRHILDETGHSNQVQHIWSPGSGLPPLVATKKYLYRFDGGFWRQSAGFNDFFDAQGDLILARSLDDGGNRSSLFRFQQDGTLERECPGYNFHGAYRLLRSRHLLLHYGGYICRLDDCRDHVVLSYSGSIMRLSKPVLPGRNGLHLFAVGNGPYLQRLFWQPGHTLAAENLLPADENRQVEILVGDGDDLFILPGTWSHHLIRSSGVGWQQMPTPFATRELRSLASGRLVINDEHTIGLRIGVSQTDGAWQELPTLDLASHWWIDDALRPRALRSDGLWGLEDQVWSLLWELPEDLDEHPLYPRELSGLDPDDLYLLVGRLTGDSDNILLHYDGLGVQRVMPDRDLTVWNIQAGTHSGRLYLEGHDAELGLFTGYIQDGDLTELGSPVSWNHLLEVDEDRVFCRTSDRLYQLGPDGWIELPTPFWPRLRGLWAHPRQGLFVISDRGDIHHRDLPRGMP